MKTEDIIRELREKNHLTQEQMAQRLHITRQAVSRWENGDTQPDTESLKLLSREFNVSINTLLGSPVQLVCQCCGMPMHEDEMISRELDGSCNEDYCRWCYSEGDFTYKSKEALLDFLVLNMPNPAELSEHELRIQFDQYLSQLKHWMNFKEK